MVFYNHRLKDDYFRADIPFIKEIQYGDFLILKWPIVLFAFLFLFILLFKQRSRLKLKEAILPAIIIFLVLISVHLFSFERWFEFDDYRVIGTHHDVLGTYKQNFEMGLSNSDFYSIGMVYLVVRWFDTNFELYNALGLAIYFFIGLTIYASIYQVGKSRAVAIIAALFFITSPTYYRQTLQMQEFIGDGFSTLLVALAFFLLISRFYAGAVIFAAAALEFGLSRTHFIVIPLVLLNLFRFPSVKSEKLPWLASTVAFPILTVLYLPLFLDYIPESVDQSHWINNWKNFLRVADSVFGVTVPHEIVYPLIMQLSKWTGNFHYISIILGFVIIVTFFFVSLWLWRKKKTTSATLFSVGAVMTVAAITMPTLSGIRVIYDIEPLTSQYFTPLPTAPTSYGILSTFGVMLVVAGLGFVVRRDIFVKIFIILIGMNSLMIIKSDKDWAAQYSTPTRISNPQLDKIIPADGQLKIVYNPKGSEILSRYVSQFYQLYRIKEPLHFTNDRDAFIELMEKYKPKREGLYLLTQEYPSYKISDHSDKLRNLYSSQKVTPELLDTLIKNL